MMSSYCSTLSAFLIPSNDAITSNLRVLMATALLLAVISVFTFVFNIIIIFAVLRSWIKAHVNISLNDNITPQILMVSMAVIGSLYGILAMPVGVLEVIRNGEWILGEGFCRARQSCNQFLGTNFMLNVMCLSIDRYIAICKPLKYRVLTYKTGLVMTAASWSLSSLTIVATQIIFETHTDVIAQLLHNTSSIAKPEYYLFTDKRFALADYLIWNAPFIVSYFLYGLILLEVYRYHKRAHRRLQPQHLECGQASTIDSYSKKNQIHDVDSTVPQKPALCPGYCVSCISGAHSLSPPTYYRRKESDRSKTRRLKMFKAVRTVGFIMICYTLCWLPAWLYLTWLLDQGLIFQLWSDILVLWITYINSALNPILFCTYKPVSRAVKSLFGT